MCLELQVTIVFCALIITAPGWGTVQDGSVFSILEIVQPFQTGMQWNSFESHLRWAFTTTATL